MWKKIIKWLKCRIRHNYRYVGLWTTKVRMGWKGGRGSVGKGKWKRQHPTKKHLYECMRCGHEVSTRRLMKFHRPKRP